VFLVVHELVLIYTDSNMHVERIKIVMFVISTALSGVRPDCCVMLVLASM
jgi:hypothetical protein